MKKVPDAKVIVFNAAAVLIAVAAAAAVIRSWVFTPTAAPCSERYTSSTAFSLDRAGVVLTAADLQSSLGGKDAGVIENLAIAKLTDGPAPIAMTVSLPKGATSPHASPRGGMSFPWQPRVLQGKTAACLSYSVLLPADFQFHRGGALPGLSGSDAAEPAPDGFTARMVWRQGGNGGATLRMTIGGETRSTPADRESFAFPRGRWVKLEQEVVLNTPKQADGILRVWVDGRLAVERTDLNYRMKPSVTLSGVVADVFYGTEDGWGGAAPKDTKVSLTPFEARWQ
jgi:Polysaccharide lyase 14